MNILFISLLLTYILVHTARFYLGTRHYKEVLNNKKINIEKGEVTILQPILSGDKDLFYTLNENIKKIPYASFLWLVDKDDIEGIKVTDKLKTLWENDRDIEIMYIDKVPQGVNPKVYKMSFALDKLKEFVIVLDDDTIIKKDKLPLAIDILREKDMLITGLPCYESSKSILSNIVGGFINSNSLGTYMATAKVNCLYTINGMFYITRTSTLKRIDAFSNIMTKLCDDYEIAKVYTKNNIPLVQSNINCIVSTDVKDFIHYINLMKRWMVFANRYISKNLSINLFLLVILPSMLPPILLFLSIYNHRGFLLLFIVHLSKCIINLLIRRYLYKNREYLKNIIYEIISDYMQFFHYLHSIISPNRIKWRDKYIKLKKDSLAYGDF